MNTEATPAHEQTKAARHSEPAHKEAEKPKPAPHRIHQGAHFNRSELLKRAAEQDLGHAQAVEIDRKQQVKRWREEGVTMGHVTVMVNGTTHRVPAQPITVDQFVAMIRVPGPLKLDGRLLSDGPEVLNFAGGEYFTTS